MREYIVDIVEMTEDGLVKKNPTTTINAVEGLGEALSGAGSVTSVNGKVGDVVLRADDVDYRTGFSVKQEVDRIRTSLNGAVLQADFLKISALAANEDLLEAIKNLSGDTLDKDEPLKSLSATVKEMAEQAPEYGVSYKMSDKRWIHREYEGIRSWMAHKGLEYNEGPRYERIWDLEGLGDSLRSMAVDAQGNLYLGVRSDNKEIIKCSPSGKRLKTFEAHDLVARGLDLDKFGNIYAGGTSRKIVKLSPLDEKIWEFTGVSDWVQCIKIDSQGFIYSGTDDGKVMKISPDGSKVWESTNHTRYVYSVDVDSQGYIYSGSYDNTVVKMHPTGDKAWEFTGHTGIVYSVAADNRGYVYSGSSDQKLIRISPSGKSTWEFTGVGYTLGTVNAVAADSEGYAYLASAKGRLSKISPSGNEVWGGYPHTLSLEYMVLDNLGSVYASNTSSEVMKVIQFDEGIVNSESGAVIKTMGDSIPFDHIEITRSPMSRTYTVNAHDGQSVGVVAATPDGGVYSAGDDSKLVRRSPSGDALWEVDLGRFIGVRSIAVDPAGRAYLAQENSTVACYSLSGDKLWGHSSSNGICFTVCVDPMGDVISGYKSGKVMKISQNGEKVWELDLGDNVVGVDTDGQGNIYAVTSGGKLVKLRPTSSKIWEFTGDGLAIGADTLCSDGKDGVCVSNTDGHIIGVTPAGGGNWTFDKLSSASLTCTDMRADANGSIYATYAGAAVALVKIHPSERDFDIEYLSGDTSRPMSVSVDSDFNVYCSGSRGFLTKYSQVATGYKLLV